jgi:vacuolar protein-sorting-associated protein 4
MHTLGTHAQVDALVSARTDGENDTTRRLKNELLVRMSEAAQGVLVLAATNVPWALDPAVRRRFERRIHVPLPEAEARATLLRIHLGATPHELSAHEVLRLATRLDGFSGSDLSVLVRGALREAQHAPQRSEKPSMHPSVVEAVTIL